MLPTIERNQRPRRRASARPALAWVAASSCAVAIAAQEVRLPLDRFHELERRASSAAPVVPPAAPYALRSARLDLAVGATSALATMELDLAVLADGWHALELQQLGRWVGAELGALEGRLDGGTLHFRGIGEHRIVLVAVAGVLEQQRFGRRTLTLEVAAPLAAVVTGQVSSGLDVATVEAAAGAIVLGDGTLDGAPARFAARPGATVSLVLHTAAPAVAAPVETRFEATALTVLRARPTRLLANDRIELLVSSGALAEVAVALPAGSRMETLRGDRVAGWRRDEGAGGAERLLLSFDPPLGVDGAAASTIEIVRELPIEVVANRALVVGELPEIEGAARTRRIAAIEVLADGIPTLAADIAGREPPRATALAPEAVPATLSAVARRSAVLLSPDDPAPRWNIEWPDDTQVLAASVDRLRMEWLVGTSGRAAVRLHVEVRSRGDELLELELPDSFELSVARLDGRDVSPGRVASSLAVPLVADGLAHRLYLEGVVATTTPAAGGMLELWVPAASVPISRIEVRALLDGRFSYRLDDPARYEGAAGQRLPPEHEPELDAWQPPAGFAEIGARWSALSNRPSPLRLQVLATDAEAPWF